jgi:replicative DNA helicase
LQNMLRLGALPIAGFVSASVPAGELSAGTRLVEGPAAEGDAPQESIALSSGLRDLDRLTNGLSPGSMIVIASRPSLGKSLLVLQIADHVARADHRAVTIVCAHDGAASIGRRLVSLRAGVWTSHFRTQGRSHEMASSVALAQVATVRILLDDTPHLTVAQIANRTTRFASERSVPLGAIIVDGTEGFVQRRSQSASGYVAEQLRSVSQALSVPVIVTVGISRAVERRRDKRPRITDFAEPNAAFVRAADAVLTIYRDDVYNIGSPDAGTAELTLLRHPFGKLGTVRVRLGEGRFEDC